MAGGMLLLSRTMRPTPNNKETHEQAATDAA